MRSAPFHTTIVAAGLLACAAGSALSQPDRAQPANVLTDRDPARAEITRASAIQAAPIQPLVDAETETWIETVDGETLQFTGTTGPRYEPRGGYSARRRHGELERAALRDSLDWGALPEAAKAALWPMAVGPDNINARGILQVSFVWAYTPLIRGDDHRALDMVLNLDGDVVVVGQGLGDENSNPEFSSVFCAELEGASNGDWQENWESEIFIPGASGDARFVASRKGAVDFSGNTYVVGRRKNGNYIAWKIDGETGSTQWADDFAVPGGTDAIAQDIAVDAEGLIYITGFYQDDVLGDDAMFVARHRPGNGGRDWIVTLGQGNPTGGIEIDRRGDLFVAGDQNANHTLFKLSPYDGEMIWSDEIMTATTDKTNVFLDSLKLDQDGNPCFASDIETAIGEDFGWRTTKWDGETGARLWSETTNSGRPRDLEVDQAGNVYVCGTDSNDTFVLRKYAAITGNQLWKYESGSTGRASDIAIDRLGNPYMTGFYDPAFIQTTKHNPVDGTIVWIVDDESPLRNNEINSDIETRDIIVDAGGNVYVSGFRDGETGNTGEEGREMFVVKYEQPYLSIPQITRSYPQLSMSGVSVWNPVPNDDDPDYTDPSTILAYNQEWDLFSFDVPGSIENAIEGPGRRTIDYGIGNVSGGLDVRNFSGGVDVSLVAESSAGTFDASMTGELAIAIPGEGELFPTQPFDIVVNWDPDEMGIQMIVDAEPTLTAGINAKTRGNLDLRFQFSDSFLGAVSSNIADINLRYEPDDPIIGIGPGSLPEPGLWVELVEFPFDQYFSGQVRSPLLQTEGFFLADQSMISSNIRQKVLAGKIRATNLVLAYFGQPPLSVNAGAGGGGNGWEAEFEAGLLQADLDTDLFVVQDIDLQLRPYVILDYESSDGTSLGSTRLDFFDVNQGTTTPVEQRTATVTLPADGELEIQPRFGADVVFTNSSGFDVVVTRSFNPIKLEASVALADSDLIDVNKCIDCIDRSNTYEVRVGEISKAIAFPSEDELAPIQVFDLCDDTDPSNCIKPQLIGASLETARMIIYDQRTPTIAEFNSVVEGTIPVVLYGYNFFSGTGISVRMKHQGRNESLERTRLNNQAILVQIPKRMLLVPGTARLLVINDNGRSETIDLVIEHPFPNFLGISEEYWASDPRWQENSVRFIDGGTPAGNDSFIVRRDYYSYLAENLWSSAILQDLNNPDQEAWEYFEDFPGWERPEDPLSAPGIPTILVDGQAIPRDPSNPSNGRLRAEFPESVVASPGFVDIQIISPGPGGGVSRPRTIELPAPRPVISRIEPELIRPGEFAPGEIVRIAVEGPASVPFFPGFEGEKFGNFTPLTQVWIGKTPVATDFISSSELVAFAPASLFQDPGTRLVRVVTSNPGGSDYFDFQITGNNETDFSGMVPSGGTSVELPLRVSWPAPTIGSVSHSMIEQGLPPELPVSIVGEDVIPSDLLHNFTIFGQDFAPGCRVYINGRLASSTRDPDSSGIVRATLLARDVMRPGLTEVYVQNPAPDLRGSNIFRIVVVPSQP